MPYLESAGHDVSASGIYSAAGVPGYGVAATASVSGGGSGKKAKSAHKIAQEQLRFCKEVIKEMFKKVHEAYAYPFYQPVGESPLPFALVCRQSAQAHSDGFDFPQTSRRTRRTCSTCRSRWT